MKKPSYEDLQAQIRELQKIVNMKVYPQEIHFETKDLLYYRIDRDWFFDSFHQRICHLTEYSPEEFSNRKVSWLGVVHPDDRPSVKDALKIGLESDDYYLVECRIITKQGRLKWVKMRGPIFHDADGEFLYLQGIMNDITSQKHTEMALESEHEVFVWVANCLEDGIYIVSDDYRIVFMNEALIQLVGNHVGETCYQALFGRETVCPWTVMDVIKKERCGFQEYHLPGLGKTFQVRSFPIKSRDGSIGKLGQLKDITQTNKLRHEVQEFAHRHQAIVNSANVAGLGIFIIQNYSGVEAMFRYVNEALCRMTGYTEDELLSKSMADLVPPGNVEEVLERYRQRQRGEVLTHAYELKLVRKDGIVITVYFSVAISSYERNVATIGFVRDITESKKMQRSLELSQRLASIGKLAAEIAHEINNPLTSVLTFSKLVNRILQQEPFPLNRMADIRKFVSLLNEEAGRCSSIARNLLDFARQTEIEATSTDINEIIEKTIEILRHRAHLNGIEIVTTYGSSLPHLTCDFKRLQQAFINLFWNGMEAMPRGGVLSIATGFDVATNLIRIDIRDTGLGISEQNLENIFEPFFTTKSEGKGVGLGLSVAYGIIRRHKGDIQVQSQLNQGAHFIITFNPDNCQLEDHELPMTGEYHD
jgi:PAS domain S-box-containing protein